MDMVRKTGTMPYLAAAMFALLGIGLALAQWQNLRSQRQGLDQYLFLSAKTTLMALEGPILRLGREHQLFPEHDDRMGDTEPRPPGGREEGGPMGPDISPEGPGYMAPPPREPLTMEQREQALESIRNRLQDLEEGPAVALLGVFHGAVGTITSPSESETWRDVKLPEQLAQILARDSEWHGVLYIRDRPHFFYARHPSRPFARMMNELFGTASDKRRTYVVVGMDMEEHMSLYRGVARTVFLQTVFMLIAVVVAWWLVWVLGKRRLLAGRARELERFNSLLLDNLPDGLVNLSADGTILAANPAAHAILGCQGQVLAGTRVDELGPEQAALFPSPGQGDTLRWQLHSHKGRELELMAVALPAGHEAGGTGRDQGQGQGFLVLIRDRTEMRRLEEELTESRHFAAIGALAAGVAHEVRNPLGAIRGFAQYFGKRFRGSEPEEQYAETMVREADRLNRVVGDLLYLSRPREPQRGHVDLEAIFDELSGLLAMDLEDRRVELARDFAVPEVYADHDLLMQVLINLVLNAVQALSEGEPALGARGRILVASKAADENRKGVVLAVSDNGPGMEQDMVERAFDPFVTGRAQGSGLGLALVGSIVRSHGGTVAIHSNDRQGTLVELFFPDPDDNDNDLGGGAS